MKNTSDILLQDPKTIEKELGEFLNKKFGGTVRLVTPSPQPRKESIIGKSPGKGRKDLINFTIKPTELMAYLDQYVVRQDHAKSVLATKICTHFNRIRFEETHPESHGAITGHIKSNILMLGPTGIGKTYLIKLIARKIGVPFVKADATKFSETGYVGGDVEDMIRDLVREANDDIPLAECGIIYIDEVDKIAASPNVIGTQVSRTGVQRALLKPMEETDVDLKVPHDPVSMMQELEIYQRTGKRSRRRVNTGNILFILSGAFSGLSRIVRQRVTRQSIGFNARLHTTDSEADLLRQTRAEDLVSYGFESEFIGRIPVRCVLETLSESDLTAILKMPNNPVILGKRLDFSAYGIDLAFTDDALQILAARAFQENTGARGLVSAVEGALLAFEEKLPATSVTHLLVNRELLESPGAVLADIIAPCPLKDWKDLHRQVREKQIADTRDYIRENWQNLTHDAGPCHSPARCNMIARHFWSHVMEIEAAIQQIHYFYDQVKEIESGFYKSDSLNLVFEEDAIDFLIQQFSEHGATVDEIQNKLHQDFYDGLNLVREKTGNNRFFLTREDLADPETCLTTLIRKEIR